ncbi:MULTISPECIES: RNA-guided endonuclease InsQ/TnpB family protein [Nostocales]|uniref:Transposase, IS607 family protein n=2 Tax=Dolichospermum TaxID=748770 RepID=A0A480A8X7_9CYAN|nr:MULTISPECIES: RNA-guided endonuclease TnpB family protein [Nostocales]MBD2267654.1 IS200/IS605 family element transposase accessory protein TnpB [Anabaena sp. FACHB-1391]GCL41417.1 transposase, IS607 family protein [Dolichospermum planctonicum]
MLLGFKTELKVNKQQKLLLAQHAGVARHAWNQGLALCQQVIIHNKLNPEDKIKFPTAIDLHKWLVASVKSQCQWYYEVSKCAPQYALRYLSEAFKSFFKKNTGFPKFKKKGKHDSFTLDGAIHIEQKKVKVPVIGWLKTYEVLPFGYQPKSVTISKQADKWFVSWKIEVETSQNPKKQECVGVDLGINHLAMLSTGEVFDGLKSYKKYESKLARMQYLNRHKKVGSNNYIKSQIKIARLHQKIANMRKDTLHKITTYISKNHAVIGIEDLNVSGMLANGKLSKAIADMGFYEFRRQLEYKTQLYGSKLVVVDRFYPSSKTCSSCGEKKSSLSLSQRVFKCEKCGFECDRDVNAAINLKQEAVRLTVLACGLDSADTSRMKQEEKADFC